MSKQFPLMLFSANDETNNYNTQGEGMLNDLTYGKVSGGLTDSTTMQIQYPIDGVNAELLAENKILYAKVNEFQDEQRFRITSIKKSLNGRMYDIKAEPIFNDIRRYFISSAGSPELVTDPNAAWNQIKSKAVPAIPNRFTMISDLTTSGRFYIESANALEALGGKEGSMLDTFGGEYIRDNTTLRVYSQFGNKNVSYLVYGKNIQGLDMEVNIENIIIGIYPFFKKDDTTIILDEKILKYPSADTFPNGRIEPVDFSDEFGEDVIPTQQQLKDKATTYMNQKVNNEKSKPLINAKIDFLELSHYSEYYNFQQLVKIGLGDVVNVYYPPMNVDVESRVIKYEYDMVKGQYDKLELGKIKANFYTKLQDNIKDVENQIQDNDFNRIQDAIDDAIQDASDEITGNKGGNVVLSPSKMPEEILIMDTDDKATAKDVLRLNKSGIGFSRTGYNGTYTTAWTISGAFNANFITAGTLKAINIEGVNIKGSVFEASSTDFTMKLEAGRMDFTKNSNNTRIFSIAANYPSGSVASNGVSLLWGDTNGFVNIGQRDTASQGWGYLDHNRGLSISTGGMAYRSIGTGSNALYTSITLTPDATITSAQTHAKLGVNAYKNSAVSTYIEMGVGVSNKTSLVQLDNSTFKIMIGNFQCYGTKNSAVVTDSFGHRLLNAYETPEYLFATYGKVTTDADGYAQVIIDPVFLETINTDSKNYHVFLSNYGEYTSWIDYLESDSFMVVTSEPNSTVSWNLVAYRKDYEEFYLETPESNANKTGNMHNKLPDKTPTELDYLTGGVPIVSYPKSPDEIHEQQVKERQQNKTTKSV